MATFAKLTRAGMRGLKPGQSLSEHGITYTRLAGGDARWTINVMVNRIRHHQVVGLESEGFTRTQAEEVIANLRAKKREAAHGVAAPKQHVRLTIAAASAEYLDYLRAHAGKDIEGKEARFRLHLNRLLGTTPVVQFTEDHWQAYVAARRSEKASDATINREAAALAHMLRTGAKRRQWRPVQFSPGRLAESPGKLVYLSPDQHRRLIDSAAADQSPHALPFVMIAGFTGMRQEPVLALKVGDVDVDRRIIWVGKDKAGRREQPMPQILADFLRVLLRDRDAGEWIFATERSSRGRAYQINGVFARCVARAGLPDNITPHTLRHTVASNAAHAGLDAATIQAIGGWKTRAMAERYTHAANVMTAMDAVQHRLSGTVSQKLHRTPENQS